MGERGRGGQVPRVCRAINIDLWRDTITAPIKKRKARKMGKYTVIQNNNREWPAIRNPGVPVQKALSRGQQQKSDPLANAHQACRRDHPPNIGGGGEKKIARLRMLIY